MPKSVTVTLAGREFEVVELPARANVAWRKELQRMVVELVDRGVGLSGTALGEGTDTAKALDGVMELVAQAPETATRLMCEYSPAIDQAWKEIEELVYESELIDGFMQVCKLAFPFGKLVDLYKSLSASSGAIPRRMQPNLH